MKTILKITKNELSSLFYSPIAWLILIIFTFQSGLAYASAWSEVLRSLSLGYNVYGITERLLLGWSGALTGMQDKLYLYIPLLTMGLMSQEYSRGSIKLLYSSPITNRQIIFGKYLAVVIYALVLMAVLCIYCIFTFVTIKNMDVPYAMTALLGMFLMICAYAAIGLFMSTLTSYQVVAAVGTLATLAVLNYIGKVGQDVPFVRDITYWLSISGRADTFFKGMICSEDFLYFILVISLFITFSILRLQAERTKRTVLQSSLRYGGVVVLTLVIGFISARPVMRCYYDATEMKNNTLSQNSIDVMEKLDGPLSITAYVNMLDDDYYRAMPRYYKDHEKQFEKYIRFKPEIKLNYVYYYDSIQNAALARRYPGLDYEQCLARICDAEDWTTDMVLKPDEIKQIEDLSGEYNKLVRVLERGNGQKTFLRIYDDNYREPSETEITAALKRMVVKSPMVAFLEGHGERSINGAGDRDYYAFTKYKAFRNSLINQGFNTMALSLDSLSQVPDYVDILVIADVRHALSAAERAMVDAFIDKGGNMLIAGEPRRQEEMNLLLKKLGLKFMPGQLVRNNADYPADLILSHPTSESVKSNRNFYIISHYKKSITMPGAVGIEKIEDKGFTLMPMLASDSTGSWNELETVNFVEDTVRLNTAIGEVEQANVTMYYLTREVNGKEQRIIVLGDADCIGNGELTRRRDGIDASNFTLVTESFRLLSNDEFPIVTTKRRPTDDKAYLGQGANIWLKLLFIGFLPGLLVFFSIGLWWKRHKK